MGRCFSARTRRGRGHSLMGWKNRSARWTRSRASLRRSNKMKTTKLYLIGLAATMLFTFSQQTFAQDFYSSPGYTRLIDNLVTNYIWNSSMKRYTGNSTNKNPGGSGASQSRSSSQSAPYEVPAYRRYPAVQFKPTGTRLTLQEYLDSVNASPQDKAELKELVLKIFKEYETAAAA